MTGTGNIIAVELDRKNGGAEPQTPDFEDIAMATHSAKRAAHEVAFGDVSVIDVARVLLGEESLERSTATEKHFPDHAGLFVNVEKNRWYCHGDSAGGDGLGLVKFVEGCDVSVGIAWLQSHGFLDSTAPRSSASAEPHKKHGSETTRNAPSRLIATYAYRDQDGADCYFVNRYEPKRFSQWRMIDGERVYGVTADVYERQRPGAIWMRVKNGAPRPGYETRDFPGVTPLPYRLLELLESSNTRVLIPGGEKDTDNLRDLGFTATTNHGGEGHWHPELSQWLKGRRVFLLCDNDQQGEKHQAVVGAALAGIAGEIRVVRFPELPEHGDVSDFIEQRRKDGLEAAEIKQELIERFKAAPAWEPSAASVEADWPEPIPLPEGLSPVDALDTTLLPAAIEPWVGDISERMQCPPDYVAIAALTALGAGCALSLLGLTGRTDATTRLMLKPRQASPSSPKTRRTPPARPV